MRTSHGSTPADRKARAHSSDAAHDQPPAAAPIAVQVRGGAGGDETSLEMFPQEDDDSGSNRSATAPASGAQKPRRSSGCAWRTLCNDVIVFIASFCDDVSLTRFLACERRTRSLLLAHDEFLWRPRCAAHWSCRQVHPSVLRPFVTALAEGTKPVITPAPALAPPIADLIPSGRPLSAAEAVRLLRQRRQMREPARVQPPTPSTWRSAYAESRTDGRRTALSLGDLQRLSWRVEFLTDATLPPQDLSFEEDGRVLRTAHYPPLPCALYEGGTQLHVHVFPSLQVARCAETWAWRLSNPFIAITTATSAVAPVTGTAAVAPAVAPAAATAVIATSPTSTAPDAVATPIAVAVPAPVAAVAAAPFSTPSPPAIRFTPPQYNGECLAEAAVDTHGPARSGCCRPPCALPAHEDLEEEESASLPPLPRAAGAGAAFLGCFELLGGARAQPWSAWLQQRAEGISSTHAPHEIATHSLDVQSPHHLRMCGRRGRPP